MPTRLTLAWQLEEELCEDPELLWLLPSCTHLELQSGKEVLRLAWHKSTAENWVRVLHEQCLLSYQKSAVFSDKQLPVRWMDGEVRVLMLGENTSAGDLVRRLCRGRKRRDGQPDPLITDATEWALFDCQWHRVANGAAGHLRMEQGGEGAESLVTDDVSETPLPPQLEKLPNAELVLNQLLLRWEVAMRRHYGAAPVAPQGAFELVHPPSIPLTVCLSLMWHALLTRC